MVREHKKGIATIDIAINKAYTSWAFEITTKELAELSQPDQQFFFGIQTSSRTDKTRGSHQRAPALRIVGRVRDNPGFA